MALRLSTGARNAMLGKTQSTVRSLLCLNTISFDSASKEIRDSGSGLVTAGFIVGDLVRVAGSASNNSTFTVTAVAAGALTVSESVTDEAAGTVTALAAASGGSLRDVFENGILEFYSGSQPSSPDDAVQGTLLFSVTVGAGTFTPGSEDSGLEFGDATEGYIEKASGETWQGVGVAAGTVGWFRLKGNATDTGASSTTLPRIDGSVGTSGADLNMAATTIAIGATYTIDTFKFTYPMQYGA